MLPGDILDSRSLDIMNTGNVVIGHTFYQSLIPIGLFYCQEHFLIRVSSNYLDKRLPKIVQVGITYYQLFDMGCFAQF
jgi:hypothetical protein